MTEKTVLITSAVAALSSGLAAWALYKWLSTEELLRKYTSRKNHSNMAVARLPSISWQCDLSGPQHTVGSQTDFCKKNSNMAVAKLPSVSWQCDLNGPQQRLEYLFNTGCFSDIIIKCPGGFSYELHRVVLAMCSPVFEAMMFGPLATSHDSLYLDDDHEILKYVFAHCYGSDCQCDDINIVLEIFKIADKYIFNDLKNKCTVIIQKLIKPENFKTIYDFSVRYGYTDFRNCCIKYLQQDRNIIKATSVLMWFSLNSPRDLLMPIFAVEKLSLETWRKPKSFPFGDLVTILQSNCCNGLKEFAGQVSGPIIEYIPGPLRSSVTDFRDLSYAPVLKLSLRNDNAKGVIMALHKRYKKYGAEDIGLHIMNEDIPLVYRNISSLPCYNCDSDDKFAPGRVTLYLSDLTKENVSDLNYMISHLKPDCNYDNKMHAFVNSYMFPRCKITKEDFNMFAENVFAEHYADEFSLLPCRPIWMCSPHIKKKDKEKVLELATDTLHCAGSEVWEFFYNVRFTSSDNEIPGW